MFVEVIGSGQEDIGPDLAVVGGIHGDEPCGKRAIERIIEEYRNSKLDIQKPVKFIIANEKALESNQRFVESDLNRVFPGDPEGVHEERIANRLVEEIEGSTSIALHSTYSYSNPFAVVARIDETAKEVCGVLGFDKIIDTSVISEGRMVEHCKCVDIECGFQGSDEASENAYEIIKRFLAGFDALNDQEKEVVSDPEVYKIYKSEDKEEGKIYEFVRENFELVEEGSVFALGDGKEIRAEEDFYPALMSSEGYTDIVGYKARKVGRLSEL